MPDFGLTQALKSALEAASEVKVMRPAETKLAAQAAKTAPTAAAPEVPVAAAPSVQAPSATPKPGAVQAPPLDPSAPPRDIPAPAASDAVASPAAVPAPPDVASAAADGAPPVPPAAQPPPVAPEPPTPARGTIAPANKLPAAPAPAPAAPTDVQQAAQRFLSANMGDFTEKLDMTHMPNVDTMQSPDGVKAGILQMADDNKGVIEAARGVAATHDQLIGMAQDLSINEDVLRQRLNQEFGSVAEGDQRRAVITAARIVEQNTFGNLVGLSDKVARGAATSDEIIQWHQYSDAALNWRTNLAGASAETGRDLNALGIKVGDNLPQQVKDHIAQVLQQNNPDLVATAKAIRLANSPAGIANIVSGMANVPAWRKMFPAVGQLIQRVFINGILSSPATWFKIFTGNTLNLAINSADIFAAGIGRGMVGLAARAGGWPTAAEGATISDAFAHVHGVISGGADALRVAGRALRTGQSLDRVSENLQQGRPQNLQQWFPDSYFGGIIKTIDNVVDIPGRIIGSIDEFTKTLGYRGYATMMALKDVRAQMTAGTLRPGDAEQAMKGLMENPSPELQQAAEAWAHRMTFQTPFPEGGTGEAFQKLLSTFPPLRFIFPFMRTATNIFKQSMIERTPLALFSARIQNQLAAGVFEADLAKSRIATGTAAGSMFAWMAIHDRITGDAPKDPKARMAWELDGREPYSIRITNPITGKDSWRSYSWFEPVATHVGAIADIVALQSYIHSSNDVDTMMPHDHMLNDAIAHVMASIVQNTGNKTFMQGAAQFSEMYNDPQRAFSMWADQMAANAMPYSGATKFMRNIQDPLMRQAFTLIDKIKNQLPTIGPIHGSKTLMPRLDVFGEPRVRQGANEILGPMSPLPGSDVKGDSVTKEIQDVMEQTRTVPITMPSPRLAYLGAAKGLQDGQGMPLTPSEYYDYTRLSRSGPVFDGGKTTFREKLAQQIASPVYQESSPAERHELLSYWQRQADKAGAKALWNNNDDFRERMQAWTADANSKIHNK